MINKYTYIRDHTKFTDNIIHKKRLEIISIIKEKLIDGNFIISGSISVKDPNVPEFEYIEKRVIFVLNKNNGNILSETIYENKEAKKGKRDGFMCVNNVNGSNEYIVKAVSDFDNGFTLRHKEVVLEKVV